MPQKQYTTEKKAVNQVEGFMKTEKIRPPESVASASLVSVPVTSFEDA